MTLSPPERLFIIGKLLRKAK